MRILYITMLNSAAKNGGYVYRWAIGKSLSSIVGKENLDIVTSELDDSKWEGAIQYKIRHYESGMEKTRNLLYGNITQISRADEERIVDLINHRKYDLVVFGCSETGHLMKSVKKTGVTTMTLYNDIIADSVKRKLQLEKRLTYVPVAFCEMHAERCDVNNCDIKIVLNERDDNTMYRYYHKHAEATIPICIEDSFLKGQNSINNSGDLILLFVGSYGWSPNPEGILWFCEYVMPKLPSEVKLKIAGYGMEELRCEDVIKNNINIEVTGAFDDINELYSSADIVIAPILTGTGMKTKTAEALMHGKMILGSTEALEGYIGLDEGLCRTADEYIEKILSCLTNRPNRYLHKNRLLYENNYSVDSMTNRLISILDEVEKAKNHGEK